VFPASQPEGRRFDRSGAHVLVSDAAFDEFPRQVAESIAFLQTHFLAVQRMCEWPGVEDVTLDFGVARRDAAVQRDLLPKALVRLAGELGMSIGLSQYPPLVSNEDAEQSLAAESR
jgi:hypothetical protein